MRNIIIKVSRGTREVETSRKVIGNDNENLQGKLVFTFSDEFVNGQARIEYIVNGKKNYQVLTKDDKSYTIPIKNVLTKKGQIEMQLVITEGTNEDEIPVFKSNVFYMICERSINAEIEQPDEYLQWIEIANTKLNALDEAIEKSNNLDIDLKKEENVTTITLTNKDGLKEETTIEDGVDFEYEWQGTSLGVKTSEESEYQYVDLKGNTGEPGYTPVRGKDYYTEQDQKEMVQETKQEVLNQISIPTKTSDLTNDSGFIDNSVNNLVNYYPKNDLYNKTEIDSKVSSIYKYKGSVASYDDLPSVDLTIGDVYNVETDGSNYAWNGTTWDKLGGDVDLSNYYNKTQTNDLLNGKVDNATLNDYYTKTRADELLGGKVGFTDYAGEKVAGIVAGSSTYGVNVGQNTGVLYGNVISYSNYQNSAPGMFISKGTLDNVLNEKIGSIDTILDAINGEVI